MSLRLSLGLTLTLTLTLTLAFTAHRSPLTFHPHPNQVVGMQSRPEFNGKKGHVDGFDESSGRYHVSLQQVRCS